MIKYCGRCGRPYRAEIFQCPDCFSPEFSLEPGVLTTGWKRRQKIAAPKKKPKQDPETKQGKLF